MGTDMWGTLHWGSPAGSSTSVPSGVVESSNTWRDELAWWRAALGSAPAVCARGPLSNAGAGLDLVGARQDGAADWHAEAGNRAVVGAPGALPAAPPTDQGTWRCIIAFELCEAGARARAARRVLLALGGRQTGARLMSDCTVGVCKFLRMCDQEAKSCACPCLPRPSRCAIE